MLVPYGIIIFVRTTLLIWYYLMAASAPRGAPLWFTTAFGCRLLPWWAMPLLFVSTSVYVKHSPLSPFVIDHMGCILISTQVKNHSGLNQHAFDPSLHNFLLSITSHLLRVTGFKTRILLCSDCRALGSLC
jgi:hypothetical protein